VTSDFYVERRFRTESDGQKEAKNAVRCGSVFQKDPTVAVTGFVKRATVVKRRYITSSVRLNTRLFFRHMPATFLRYESADRCQCCQPFTQCSEMFVSLRRPLAIWTHFTASSLGPEIVAGRPWRAVRHTVCGVINPTHFLPLNDSVLLYAGTTAAVHCLSTAFENHDLTESQWHYAENHDLTESQWYLAETRCFQEILHSGQGSEMRFSPQCLRNYTPTDARRQHCVYTTPAYCHVSPRSGMFSARYELSLKLSIIWFNF
jgi:hypothetical protein